MIAQNVDTIRRRIAAACQRVGRDPGDVTLVAVTKTVDSIRVREAVDAGVLDLGENFVQELLKKRQDLLPAHIRWHFIGHLQSNKVKHIVDWVHLVHSVDSLSLGSELSRRAATAGRRVEVLIEVNSTGESAKFGVRPEDLPALAGQLRRLPNLAITGLMTVGPFLPDPESSRPAFRLMRSLRERLAGEGPPLPHLSMGMTHDFEVAIEEGATMVRIGTAIFGPRAKAGNN